VGQAGGKQDHIRQAPTHAEETRRFRVGRRSRTTPDQFVGQVRRAAAGLDRREHQGLLANPGPHVAAIARALFSQR
jgi:hypothetical protein